MTTYASDSFTRTDTGVGGGLGTADVGGTWSNRSGTAMGIVSNKGRSVGAGLSTLATGQANGVISAKLALTMGIAFRVSDANNFWWAMPYVDGNIYVGKMVAGSYSFEAILGATFVADSILEITLNGSAITIKISATAGGTPATVSGGALTGKTFNQTATDHGFYNWSGSDSTFDDFSFVSLGGGGGGYSGATLTTADTALVAAIVGGHTAILQWLDARRGVNATSSLVDSWDDYRGASGFGPSMTATAASGSKPAFNSTAHTVTLNQSGSQNSLSSATSTAFDPTNARSLAYGGTLEASQNYVDTFQSADATKIAGFWSGFDAAVGAARIRADYAPGVGIGFASGQSTTPQLVRVSFPGSSAYPLNIMEAQTGGRVVGFGSAPSFASGSWRHTLGGTPGASSPAFSHQVAKFSIVFDHVLNDVEEAALEAWAASEHGFTIDATRNTGVWDGNSISAGYAASTLAHNPVSRFLTHFPGWGEFVNNAISGQSGDAIAANLPYRTLPSFAAGHPRNVYILWGEGTNEIRSTGHTPTTSIYPAPSDQTTIIDRIKTMAAAAKAKGALVGWASILPFNGSADEEAVRVGINAYFRTNWASYFDAIADVALISGIGSSSYYVDGIHPNDAGYDLIEGDPTYGLTVSFTPLMTGTVGGPAHHLAMTRQPSNGATGVALATQPAGRVADASGTTVSSDASTVTASLVADSGTGTMIGTATASVSSGLWDYTGHGLGVNSTGGGIFHWHFDDGSLLGVSSASFSVSGTVTPPSSGDPFLVIAGITVPVMEGQAVQRLEENAEGGRTFAGNYRSVVRWSKHVWQVTTGLLTVAEAATLTAAVAGHTPVTCSGTGIGSPLTCIVLVGDGAFINTSTADGLGILRSFVLTVIEV